MREFSGQRQDRGVQPRVMHAATREHFQRLGALRATYRGLRRARRRSGVQGRKLTPALHPATVEYLRMVGRRGGQEGCALPSSEELGGLTEILKERGVPMPSLVAMMILRDGGVDEAIQRLHLVLVTCMQEARIRQSSTQERDQAWHTLTSGTGERVSSPDNASSSFSRAAFERPDQRAGARGRAQRSPEAELLEASGASASDRQTQGKRNRKARSGFSVCKVTPTPTTKRPASEALACTGREQLTSHNIDYV